MTYTKHTSQSLTNRRKQSSFSSGRPNRTTASFRGSNNRGRFGRKPSNIDISLLVRRAEEATKEETYVPQHTFADFSLSEPLKQNISRHGYTTPTPIQDQAIKPLLSGRDVIGIANTGTGKTAAFLLPLITKIEKNGTERVLIVAPTRELAVQIEEEFMAFAKGMGIYSALCIGGVSITRQIVGLRRNPHFVIGTPGRLKDLERQHKLNFSTFTTIVLDEVDRMLDMGFINDVEYIVSRLPRIRHSLFFSATLPENVKKIMQKFVNDPITVSVKSRETSANVDQNIVRVNGKAKIDVLHDLLIKDGFDKVLVFGRTKHGMEKLAQLMNDRGFKVAAIHGNKNQNQRQRAIEQFKSNQIQILLATDIASRGLDISDVTHVINYDLPESYEDYVHRIGRTGRAGKKGTALSFVD